MINATLGVQREKKEGRNRKNRKDKQRRRKKNLERDRFGGKMAGLKAIQENG